MKAAAFYGKNRCIPLPIDSDVSSSESDSELDEDYKPPIPTGTVVIFVCSHSMIALKC